MENENATPPEGAEPLEDRASVWKREFEGHLNQWKSTLDELEVQLALGKAEASDKFAEWKETFGKQINTGKSMLTPSSETLNWADVKAKFEHLEVQLALGKMEAEDAYQEQKDKILEAIDDAKRDLQRAVSKVSKEFQEEADGFRATLENYQVQFALGKYEARDTLEDKKKELRDLVHEFRTKMDTVDVASEDDKFDAFMEEMGKSYEHLKSAFTSLLD